MRTPKDETTVAELVGAEIRRLREARGWTLRQLADATDLDFGFIGKIERGADAATETYRRIARALGITMSVLFAAVDPSRGGRTASRVPQDV